MRGGGLIVCGNNSQESKSATLTEQLSKELSIPAIFLNSLGEIPLINNEIIAKCELPKGIVSLVEKIQETETLLFVFPQYNYNFSGFFKNVLDWCSIFSRRIFHSKRLILVGISQSAIKEEEFRNTITWTLESMGGEDIVAFNFLPNSKVEELIWQIRGHV